MATWWKRNPFLPSFQKRNDSWNVFLCEKGWKSLCFFHLSYFGFVIIHNWQIRWSKWAEQAGWVGQLITKLVTWSYGHKVTRALCVRVFSVASIAIANSRLSLHLYSSLWSASCITPLLQTQYNPFAKVSIDSLPPRVSHFTGCFFKPSAMKRCWTKHAKN